MIEWKPTVLIGWALFVGAYLYIVGPLRRRYGQPENRGQVIAFLTGVLLLLLALQSPLDYLAGYYLFSAHMLQHMLLAYGAAPLLVMGTPGWFLRPIIRRGLLWPLARLLTQPVVALIVFNAVFTLYHVPPLYVASLTSEPLHALMHLVFLGTAALTFWPILSPLPDLPRLSPPLQMLYLAAQTVVSQPVGALVTLASEPLYGPYSAAPRILGLTALEDQQVGGLLMWIGGPLFFFGVLTIVFFRWALRQDAGAGARA